MLPVNSNQLEQAAARKMTAEAAAYILGEAGNEQTALTNRQSFECWHIVPPMLRNSENPDLSIELAIAFSALAGSYRHTGNGAPDSRSGGGACSSGYWGYFFPNQVSVLMEACSAAMGEQMHCFNSTGVVHAI